MKKFYLLLSLLLSLTIGLSFGQSMKVVDYYNWSSPVAYQTSPAPLYKGYGPLSDSLAQVYPGKEFYELNDSTYVQIESWADYYYWFTQEYYYLFEVPSLYAYYYFNEDDYGMASYIAGNYQGRYYPTRFLVRFNDRTVPVNRMKNNRYIASDVKKETKLEKDIEALQNRQSRKEEIINERINSTNNNTSPEAGNSVTNHPKIKSSKSTSGHSPANASFSGGSTTVPSKGSVSSSGSSKGSSVKKTR